jgi:hypothetical protein
MCGSGTTRRLPEALVEPQREVAGDLEVLTLVLADGYLVGVVDEDVRGHEHRVGEQPNVPLLPLGGLVLELRHPAGLAKGGETVHDPAEFGVLGEVALAEHRGPLRVNPTRDALRRGDSGAMAQHLGVGGHGERV